MIRKKNMMPRTRGTTSRQLRTIQVTFSASASPTRQAPSVTKNPIFLARLVKRIAGPYMTILNEARAKKNRGAKAPRRKTLTSGYLLSFGLISHRFLRKNLRRRGCEDRRRFGSSRGINLFRASQFWQGNVPGQA